MLPRFFILAFALLCTSANAQFSHLEVETYAVHDASLPELEGLTTYRLWAHFEQSTDFVSAISGLQGTPLKINTSTSFYQNSAGGNTGNQINPSLFDLLPEVEFDSYLTIGRSNQSDPGINISTLVVPSEPWLNNFDNGESIVINGIVGGAWYITFGETSENGFAGDDLKVLLGQFTTDGEFNGVLNIQVFEGGLQSNEVRIEGEAFSSDPNALFGCMDESASNFNPNANVDDCTCIYDCALNIDEINYGAPNCVINNDAQLEVSISGGQGLVYFYLNDENPVVVNLFSNLSEGDYELIVIDDQGCSDTLDFDISPGLTISAALESNVLCNGDANGSISANSTGINTIFSLNEDLSNPNFDGVFNGLEEGTYTVYAQSENGCQGAANPITITAPAPLTAGFTEISDQSCEVGSVGAINATATNGTPPYTYSLDGVSWQSSNVLEADAGDYLVFVQDANNCVAVSPNSALILSTGVTGCTDENACNYNPEASCSGNCIYPTESYLDCNGNCINDTDMDGVCDELEVFGCTDENACNYDSTATEEDGSCEYVSLFSIEGDVQVTSGEEVLYTYTNTPGSSYQWTIENGTIISGQGSNSVVVIWDNAVQGNVGVFETTNTDCIGAEISIAVSIDVIGIQEQTTLSISYYPNPIDNYLNLVLSQNQRFIASIYDNAGRMVCSSMIDHVGILPTTSLASGTYILKCENEQFFYRSTIIVQH